MFRKLMIIAGSLLLSGTLYAKTVLKVNPARTIAIKGTIGSSILSDAHRLEAMSKKSTDPIFLVINSPGGSVAPGMQFLNAMQLVKNRGVRLVCFVPVQAASMAFNILAECTTRYAFKYSLLLWHPMKISGGMFTAFSADEMEYLVKVMRAWEVPLNNMLIGKLNISKELFYYHYAHETLFTTTHLRSISPNFIKIIDDVKGVKSPFSMR